MRFFHSSAFRAICTLAAGVLLILFSAEIEKWLAVVIGLLFIIPGIASVVMTYMNNHSDDAIQHDSPLVGWGSILLGIAVIVLQHYNKSTVIVILGAILIILTISTIIELISAHKYWKIGVGNFCLPILIFIIGVLVIANFTFETITDHNIIYQILGYTFAIYGIIEIYFIIRIASFKHAVKKQKVAEDEKNTEDNNDI